MPSPPALPFANCDVMAQHAVYSNCNCVIVIQSHCNLCNYIRSIQIHLAYTYWVLFSHHDTWQTVNLELVARQYLSVYRDHWSQYSIKKSTLVRVLGKGLERYENIEIKNYQCFFLQAIMYTKQYSKEIIIESCSTYFRQDFTELPHRRL